MPVVRASLNRDYCTLVGLPARCIISVPFITKILVTISPLSDALLGEISIQDTIQEALFKVNYMNISSAEQFSDIGLHNT